MALAKRIYILIIKVNKLFSFFLALCLLKEIENMYPVFLSSYRNTRESLGELEQVVAVPCVPTAFLVLPNFYSCFHNSIETRYMFSISKILITIYIWYYIRHYIQHVYIVISILEIENMYRVSIEL